MLSLNPIAPRAGLICLCVLFPRGALAAEGSRLQVDFQGVLGERDLSLLGQAAWGPTFPLVSPSVILQGEVRPIRRRTLVRENETTLWQFREDRFSLGAGLGLGFALRPSLEARISGGGLYSWGDYRGTLRPAPSDWFPWAETGLHFSLGNQWHWGFHYQWHKLPGVSPHRLALVLGLQIPERGEP